MEWFWKREWKNLEKSQDRSEIVSFKSFKQKSETAAKICFKANLILKKKKTTHDYVVSLRDVEFDE